MKLWKKGCSVLLVICFLTVGLAACTPLFRSDTDTGDDVILQATGVPKDTVVMTVNGTDITAETYCYWVISSVNYLSQQQFSSGDVVWSDTIEDKSVSDYVKDDAVETVTLYQMVEENAKKNGCVLTEASQAELDEFRAYYIQYFGGGDEAAYLEELRLQGLSEETFLHFAEVGFLYTTLFEKLYGTESGNQPSDEALQAYAEQYVEDQGYEDLEDFFTQTGYMYAKHILLKTTDDEGADLPDEEKTAKKKQAEELLAQLKASDTPLALFDALMKQHSEDPGLVQYPDGYVFGEGEMVASFETATKALDANEISGIVESTNGYHIILRRPNLDIFLSAWGQEQFTKQLETWISEADVQFTGAYQKIDPQTLYEKMNQIYEKAHPEEGAFPEESASPEGSASPEANDTAAEGKTEESATAAPTGGAAGDTTETGEATPAATE
ncbi:MAG: foldase protein PrsA [Oscillospiraceae bacterium]|jgi:hypothetical protein